MKKILLCLSLACMVNVNAQLYKTQRWKLDTASAWKSDWKSIDYTYDSNKNELGYLEQTWSDTGWVNSLKFIKEYNNKNKKIKQTPKVWKNNAWADNLMHTYTYDSFGNLTIAKIQRFQNNTWENLNLSTYTYDSSNRRISFMNQDWNVNVWKNSYKYTYHYDTGKIIHQILRYNPDMAGGWKISGRDTLVYDTVNRLGTHFTFNWNGTGWDSIFHVTYTYNPIKNSVIGLLKSKSSGVWVNGSMSRSVFNQDGTIESSVSVSFINPPYSDSMHYYYGVPTGIRPVSSAKDRLVIFPNPAKGLFAIMGSGPIHSIKVYNLCGTLVYEDPHFNKEGSTAIDLSELNKGVYFIAVQSEGITWNEKVVIE